MARLAQYMQNLAAMLGHDAAVHFDTLKPGSTQLVTKIDHEDVPKVATHLAQVKRGEGSAEATKAQTEIDRLLAEDNATGFIYEDADEHAKIIAFPGVTRPKPTTFGPFNQEGSLDGILISVSGADQTVHLQLQNGDTKYFKTATPSIRGSTRTARRLAALPSICMNLSAFSARAGGCVNKKGSGFSRDSRLRATTYFRPTI